MTSCRETAGTAKRRQASSLSPRERRLTLSDTGKPGIIDYSESVRWPVAERPVTGKAIREHYEFQAIDRPLGEADMEALRTLSTRARITAMSFTNHYKWGDFQGDPNRLIGRSRLDPFRRGCDLAEVVELGEHLIFDCYSARKFALRRTFL